LQIASARDEKEGNAPEKLEKRPTPLRTTGHSFWSKDVFQPRRGVAICRYAHLKPHLYLTAEPGGRVELSLALAVRSTRASRIGIGT
jgi:hypothetical protein